MLSKTLEKALIRAIREAKSQHHEYVTVEHLLYGLLHDELTSYIISECGGSTETLKEKLEQFFAELSNEVRRTLEYYQVQNRSVTISQVFLTGGGAKTEGLTERLSRALDLPVFLHDPIADMEITASFNREYLKGVGPQMSVAIGLAMRGLGA